MTTCNMIWTQLIIYVTCVAKKKGSCFNLSWRDRLAPNKMINNLINVFVFK
nr:MAG TPA: hypothetical protein [Caudoviricetes sp.]